MELLLNSDAHKIQQRTMGTATAKGKKSRRLLFDLPECMIRRDADRKINGSAVAGTEKPAIWIRPEKRCLQQAFLCCQSEYWVRHATTLDPRGTHFRYHVAQPARMDPSTRSFRIRNALTNSIQNKI